ncbi:hypothetical protein D7207_17530 [Burkholderia cepacia]|nr:hypothetical protein [Burkholderia cepacia]MBA9945348.1 hypothetical protein [Burkholderia cepacia]MBA9975798.1 hypothetical protein [Burkholderia cepacia]MBA9993995.1 hypothetical protein [Burkholderia cepacia]MBB0002469.1 hypothetical protein [Burkholderia cepacia]
MIGGLARRLRRELSGYDRIGRNGYLPARRSQSRRGHPTHTAGHSFECEPSHPMQQPLTKKPLA